MVVFFNNTGEKTREVIMVEHDVMSPTIPADITDVELLTEYYNTKNLRFIALPYELRGKIFDYYICVNDKEEFIGLQPKTKEVRSEY